MRWLRLVPVLVGLIALGACHVDRPSERDLSPGVDPAGNASPTLPDGWRWESYRDVEVGVPPDWGWGSGAQRLGQWCVNRKPLKPIVGRPGISTQAACVRGPAGAPPPETLIKNTGSIVSLEDAILADGTPNRPQRGGDRKVVTLGDVTVVVQVPKSLRSRIIATIHLVKVDHHGCPTTDPASARPGSRPRATSVADLVDVSAVSVCKYAIVRDDEPKHRTGLLSSSQYTGSSAARLVGQISAAPVRGGPDRPHQCSDTYGDEIIALRVTSSTGQSKVYVRYSGCDHNGFDDGVAVRRLVRAPMQALIAGPNAPSSWEGFLDSVLRRT